MIRDRIINAITETRRYRPVEECTPDVLADAILTAVPEIAGIDGLKCRDCGANQTELDQIIGDGLCDLCRDTAQAVPA